MSSRFLDRIREAVLIGDGAMGTQLDARGLEPGTCGTLWNVDRPDEVRAIHRGYLEAGADVILTNTFGGTRVALARHGIGERVRELNQAAVAVARQAVDQFAMRNAQRAMTNTDEPRIGEPRTEAHTADRFILGDVGPTGELLQPYGTRTVEEMEAVFAEQAEALAASAVDAIIVETMIAVEECAAAVRAARAATGLPVIASMAFDFNAGRDAFFTAMGVGLDVMVERLTDAGADVIGANCGSVDPVQMAGLAARLAGLTSRPIMVQPNAGRPALISGRTVFQQTPEAFAASGPALVSSGARIVGGCCGTTPAHIAALARRIRAAA